jgi:hypothetical protein
MSENEHEARAMCSWLFQRALTVARRERDIIRAVADALIREHRLHSDAFERLLEIDLKGRRVPGPG